jgi:hypothetical protein
MPKSRQSAPAEPAKRRSGFAHIEEIGDDGLRIRTIWTPFPTWLIPLVCAVLISGTAVLIAAAMGSSGDSLFTVLSIALIASYFGGGIIWAIVGAAGGDRLEIVFDGDTEVASVRQRLLWKWGRDWQFEFENVERLYVWRHHARFSLRFNDNHHTAIAFFNDKPLLLGRYHTDTEAMAVALAIASFLDLPVRRNEKPPAPMPESER